MVWASVFVGVDLAHLAFERAVMAQADVSQAPERAKPGAS